MFMWTEKVSEIDPRMWLLQVHTWSKVEFLSKNSILKWKIAKALIWILAQKTERLLKYLIWLYGQKVEFYPSVYLYM